MQLDDDTRLHHMLDAAKEAVSFVQGKTCQNLEENRQLALSLVKCIEIIGEAASKVSEEARSAHQEIPWRVIVAMRNRLIHGYFDVDLDRVWGTVNRNLPPPIEALEKIVRT